MERTLPIYFYSLAKRNWKVKFGVTIFTSIDFFLWIFALQSAATCPHFHELLILCWVFEKFSMVYCGFYSIAVQKDAADTLSNLVTGLLFLTQVFAHLTILWDAYLKRRKRTELRDKLRALDIRLMQTKLQVPLDGTETLWKLSLLLLSVVLQLIFCNLIVIWTKFHLHATSISLFWYGLSSSIALQLRILEFLTKVIFLNERLWGLSYNLNILGERNLLRFCKPLARLRIRPGKRNIFFVAPFNCEQADELQVIEIKSLLNDIFKAFQMINDCYGWSLLAFTAMYFIGFVTNSYWTVLAMITQGRDNKAFLQHASFLWIVIIMLSMVCWHCQKSSNYSRQIGCLIFKLVKPLGNKRYNDLVSEFSLQTMHQQFVITAKEFFSLNLNLLGSMVAAIVTYLVILIQFMFTEKSNLERTLTTVSNVLNSTTPITIDPTASYNSTGSN